MLWQLAGLSVCVYLTGKEQLQIKNCLGEQVGCGLQTAAQSCSCVGWYCLVPRLPGVLLLLLCLTPFEFATDPIFHACFVLESNEGNSGRINTFSGTHSWPSSPQLLTSQCSGTTDFHWPQEACLLA